MVKYNCIIEFVKNINKKKLIAFFEQKLQFG